MYWRAIAPDNGDFLEMKQRFLAACVLLIASATATAGGASQPDWTGAEVLKVDSHRSRVLLKHELIKSIGMEAMTMPFKTGPAVDLKRFKPGDRVRFTVTTKDDHLVVDAMEKLK
jgi:Cu/Ag efflux protein CusF